MKTIPLNTIAELQIMATLTLFVCNANDSVAELPYHIEKGKFQSEIIFAEAKKANLVVNTAINARVVGLRLAVTDDLLAELHTAGELCAEDMPLAGIRPDREDALAAVMNSMDVAS